jgi:hypothetical protein
VKQATIQQLLLGSGSANRRERNNSTAKEDKKIMGSGVFCAVRAEVLSAAQVKS